MLELSRKLQNLIDSQHTDRSLVDHQIDELLGLSYQEIEQQALETEQEVVSEDYLTEGLKAQALYTSYFDFYQLAKTLNFSSGETFVDLGSGMSRSKLLYNILFPSLTVIALEKSKPRIEAAINAAKQNNLPLKGFIRCDLLKIDIPSGDYYFIYLPAGRLLDHILKNLQSIASQKKIQIIAIESHGDLIKSIKENAPWLVLSEIQLTSSTPRHDQNIYIFNSIQPHEVNEQKKNTESVIIKSLQELENRGELKMKSLIPYHKHILLKKLSLSKKWELMMEEGSYQWIGSTWQLEESLNDGAYQLLYPPREISLGQIIKIYKAPESLMKWREARLRKERYTPYGEVRKIITSPEVLIEFSSGKRIPLSALS